MCTGKRFGSVESVEKSLRNKRITRVFDATVEQVWKAWTDPELVMRWWGPKGFTLPLARIDFVRLNALGLHVFARWPGLLQHLGIPENRADEADRVHSELCRQRRKKADPVAHGLLPDFPQDVRSTVIFKSLSDNKTEMTVTEYGYTSDQMLEMSKVGLEECLDKMAESLM